MEPARITARKGTLKRKQQVRNLLDHMPKDNHNDIFNNSSPMQNKWVKYMPTPSAKHVLKRCNIAENNSYFVVWEMFPDKDNHSVGKKVTIISWMTTELQIHHWCIQ